MANITKPLGLSNIWATGGTKIDPGSSKVNIGWVVQLPPYEYQNWVDNRQDQAIAHISQHGVPEWDSTTEYQGNLSYTQGSNGVIYKCLSTNINKDPANPLNSAFWVVAFEVFGSVQTVSNALAAHIADYQTLANVGNYAAARANLSVYSKAESDTRFAGLNGSSAQVFAVAVATQPEHAVRLDQVSSLLTQATESTLGVVRLATTGLTEAGVDDLTAITPLKASNVYLKKSGNLAGLGNVATARANLGLGSSATQPSTAFLQTANNLSDVPNKPLARSNLGLTTTASQPESYFLRSGLNLSDLTNVANARFALGLSDMATTPSTNVMFKYDNLFGLTDPALARSRLGLSDAGLYPSNTWLNRGSNLGDLTNIQAARNNLQLGSLATRNVYGVPGDLDFTAWLDSNGYQKLPGGLIIQWGVVSVPVDNHALVTFPIPFSAIFGGQATMSGTDAELGNGEDSYTGFTIVNNSQAYITNGYKRVRTMYWIAYGR